MGTDQQVEGEIPFSTREGDSFESSYLGHSYIHDERLSITQNFV